MHCLQQADTVRNRYMLDKLWVLSESKSQIMRSRSVHSLWGCSVSSALLGAYFSFSGQKRHTERDKVMLFLVATMKEGITGDTLM